MVYYTRWDFLVKLVNENNYKVIAEIGVSASWTTRPVIQECNLAQYFLVDPAVDKELYTDLAAAPTSFMKMTSQKAAPLIADGCLDLVFIDVDPHDYEECSRDIKLWLPKIRPGGIISGHDYGQAYPGVVKAVSEAFGNFDLEVDASSPSVSVWWLFV